MRKLKVAHLLGALNPSGMERMLSSASAEFDDLGIECVVIGQGSVHPYKAALIEAGYDVHVIPTVRSVAGVRQLQRVLRSTRPDIFHIHTESAFLSAVFASRLVSSAPIIRTIHSVFTPVGRALLSRRVQGYLADMWVARFVSPSPDVAANESKWGRRSQLIYNWVSSDYIEAGSSRKSAGRDPLLATIVGNCATVKNHEMALRYLSDAGYSVAHHGDESRASMEEIMMLDELASAGRLTYRGTAAPLGSLLRSGVFVLPSLHEGMSVALAEAIAVGTPCLVADSVGLSWAKGIAFVQHVSLSDHNAWEAALPESGYVGIGGSERGPDLSARRGAEEYANLYRTVACAYHSADCSPEARK